MKTSKEWSREFRISETIAKTIQQESIDWTLLGAIHVVIGMPDDLFSSAEAKRKVAQALAKVKP